MSEAAPNAGAAAPNRDVADAPTGDDAGAPNAGAAVPNRDVADAGAPNGDTANALREDAAWAPNPKRKLGVGCADDGCDPKSPDGCPNILGSDGCPNILGAGGELCAASETAPNADSTAAPKGDAAGAPNPAKGDAAGAPKGDAAGAPNPTNLGCSDAGPAAPAAKLNAGAGAGAATPKPAVAGAVAAKKRPPPLVGAAPKLPKDSCCDPKPDAPDGCDGRANGRPNAVLVGGCDPTTPEGFSNDGREPAARTKARFQSK